MSPYLVELLIAEFAVRVEVEDCSHVLDLRVARHRHDALNERRDFALLQERRLVAVELLEELEHARSVLLEVPVQRGEYVDGCAAERVRALLRRRCGGSHDTRFEG